MLCHKRWELRFHIRTAGRDDIEVIRKRHALVEDTGRQLRQEVGGTGEKDGCRLARNAPQRQNQSGDDIGHSHRQDDMPDGLELGGSQRAASFAHAVGDGFQCFFRGADTKGRLSKPSVNEPARMLSPKSI